MSDVRLIDSRDLHKRLSDLSERWYRAKKLGVAQGLATAIEEVCNTDTIDPIRAAGGCRCGECKNYVDAYGTGKMMCMRPIRADDYSETGYVSPLEVETKETGFCSYGEAREAQDDG